MNLNIQKEDSRLPDSWGVEIFLHKGVSKKFQVVSQRFGTDYFEIKTTHNKFHLFRHDSYSEIAFDENYVTMIDLKNEKENSDTKAA